MGADNTDKGGGGKPPQITNGSFVSWRGGAGRVNMVVTSGKVPGVAEDVTGTADAPAVRVVVWQRSGGAWKATGRRVGLKAAGLRRIPPLTSPGGPPAARKSVPGPDDTGTGQQLVALHTAHREQAEMLGAPAYTVPGPAAVKTVFERGVTAWPGEDKAGMPAEDWALGRVAAFLQLAAGTERKGYTRDVDLLPPAHPLHQS